mmetsp:Transcript_43081/g.77341  ORF Transcript_43081/g.77341 Transcript_43081/m.77341 type:complete len:219 (-) Transcript_43081:174-830(-)
MAGSILSWAASGALLYSMAVVNRVLHSPMCNWMFACGCHTLWHGGWVDCNVHNLHNNPKCPWCLPAFDPRFQGWYNLWHLDSMPDQDGLAVVALAYPMYVWGKSLRRPSMFILALICAFFAFLASEMVVGAIYGMIYDYPYFVLWRKPGGQPYHAPSNVPRRDSSGLPTWLSILIGSLGGCIWALVILGFFIVTYASVQMVRAQGRYRCRMIPLIPER